MKFEWGTIDADTCGETEMAQVFGGWVIWRREICMDSMNTSMVFIPDPNHEWVIDE